jgi:hypothetical protein
LEEGLPLLQLLAYTDFQRARETPETKGPEMLNAAEIAAKNARTRGSKKISPSLHHVVALVNDQEVNFYSHAATEGEAVRSAHIEAECLFGVDYAGTIAHQGMVFVSETIDGTWIKA